MSYQFKAHVIIKGQIRCVSGLHIGGTEEVYDIGHVDNPILRDRTSGLPYIPGSSIKGKMRGAMEWMLGKVEPKGHAHICDDFNCQVCRIFGVPADRRGREEPSSGPTRLIVRDAYVSEETKQDPCYVKNGVFRTEVKTETSLNRITSAPSPRLIERVPQGAKFDIELIYGIYDVRNDGGRADIANLQQLSMAIQMLEAGTLGGGGSRGSGQIALENLLAIVKRREDYQKLAGDGEIQETILAEASISALLANVQQILQKAN